MEAEFDARIASAERGMRLELGHEAAALKRLLLCDHNLIVEKALVELEKAKGNARAMESVAFPPLVGDEALAFNVDELYLLVDDGFIIGASKRGRTGTNDARLAALLRAPPG